MGERRRDSRYAPEDSYDRIIRAVKKRRKIQYGMSSSTGFGATEAVDGKKVTAGARAALR